MSNIVRIPAATAGTVPASGVDYQRQNDLLFAFGLWGMQAYPLDLANNKVVKGALFNVGGVLYHASADETITGTPSEYVKLTPIAAGAECSAVYVANLTGVTWSDTYNGYVDGSGNLHLFDEAKAFATGIVSTPKTFHGKAFQSTPHGRTVITATGAGSFVVPAGVYGIFVTTIGGGGGGGGGLTAGPGGGGGGGGGAQNRTFISVLPGASISYSVGAGGAGGLAQSLGSMVGASGGSTTFTGATTSVGGGGGNSLSGGTGGYGNLGLGGSGSHGSSDGLPGTGGGAGSRLAAGAPGPGGGGGGASVGGSGGAGGNGSIIVEW